MFNALDVKVFLADKNAKIPTQGSPYSAGYDIYASNEEPIEIQPGQRALIPTGLITQFPSFVYGRIADRSGVAYKMGGHVLAGVIDSDYRSTIGVVLLNTNTINSRQVITVNPGDRIAQLIFEMKCSAKFIEVSDKEKLDETKRDTGGFGSTGMN